MGEILLQMRGIQKYFPGVHALDDCHFELKSGEVHALVGENGAGKSTMMKVLTGVYQMDAGEILLDCKPVQIHNTRDAQALGISIIHQELNLMKDLTVAENIYIGREPMNGILLNKRRQNEMAAELLSSLSIDISPTTIVGTLTVARQQMVEIAKALSYDNTRILIMDEPSAALTESEIEELFRFIRDLKARGVGIVYISHRMGELKQISDRITVMRDGQYIGTVNTAEVTMDEIIRMMVGRVIYEQPKEKSNVPPDAPIVLEARHLLSKDVKDVSFVLHKGEILGFVGLVGAGRTELMHSLFGMTRPESGKITLHGEEVSFKSPQDAIKHGIAYVTEDRKGEGLVLPMSVHHNTTLAALSDFVRTGLLQDRKENHVVDEEVDHLGIKVHSVRQAVKSLSGANQQKVMLAKWMITHPRIIIFDEPTRGIDVGAKAEIYKIMCNYVAEGNAVIMISSEMPEAMGMSDRIIVLSNHKHSGELKLEEFSQEAIVKMQFQYM